MEKIADRVNSVFISSLQLRQNPLGAERLRAITKNIYWDDKNQGCYITKNSTAHSLCVLLGFEPWVNQPIPDGTYDRNGLMK